MSRELKLPLQELPPLPPFDYYVTLENGDDYGCWSSNTMREYARAAQGVAEATVSAPAQPTVPVAYGLFWQLDDADYLQFPVFPTREECEAEIQSYGEGDRARMIVRPLAIAAAAPVAQKGEKG